MKVRYLHFLLVFALFSSVLIAQETGFPIIRNYTPKEYNGASQIWSVIQDGRGIIYFGTSDGSVLEYDGISWHTIPIDNQALSYDLAIDKNGKIYITAADEFGYLNTDKNGNTIYQSLTHLINDTTYKTGNVRIVEFTSEFVYFQTDDAIIQYTPLPEKVKIFKAGINDKFYNSFVYHDTYYAQLYNTGLIKIENDEIIPALQSEFFKNKNRFRVALPYNSKTLLIPTRNEGLFLYQPDKDSIPKSFSISDKDFFADNYIVNASLFQEEYFVAGSINKGAVLFDKQGMVLQHYKESNLLQNNSIREIITDKSQNLWLVLGNGMSKTEHSLDLSYWDKNAGLKGNVQSVIRFKGKVYIATNTKIYFIDATNQLQEIKNRPAGQNWCFLEHKNLKILLAGTSDGIYEIKGDKAVQIYTGSHAAKLVQSVKNPLRVFGTDSPDFVSIRFEAGKWISEGKWSGIKGDIRGITEDETGELWLSTYRNGVIRITPDYDNITKPKKVRYYTQKDGFASLADILPFYYKNKIIWGSEKGLYIYNPETDKFDPFCEPGGQFCNGSRSVYSLTEMPDSKIWICPKENKKADIGYLKPNGKGAYDWVYAPFRRIPDMDINIFYIEPSGIVWLGGTEGLYRYDMSKDTRNYTQSFNCLIRKVTIGYDSILYGGYASLILSELKMPAELSYQFNTLKFEFAAPFFDHEEKTLYSYQLAGFDKEWSKWDRDSNKEYTNLSEGTYTFRVKALNVYDIESDISTCQIKILPPFYRTWWAYCIYFILLVLFVFIIVKLYTRSLTKQKERLKNTVEQKTREVLLQKEELETINEELIVSNKELYNRSEELESTLNSLQLTQKQLVQSEKMASLGILAAGVAHEINNPLNFISGGTFIIENFLKNNLPERFEEIRPVIEGIYTGVKRASVIVKSLSQYSRNDDLPFSKCSLHSIIDDCLTILYNQLKNRVEVQKQYTEEQYIFEGNEGKLHQAFLNILSNASQAIGDKGNITILTNIVKEEIQISITDTGHGISRENSKKVFDPFFTTKDPGKGTGLGLSITYSIIQEHEGTIELESQVGAGTKVIIKLPLKTK